MIIFPTIVVKTVGPDIRLKNGATVRYYSAVNFFFVPTLVLINVQQVIP